MATVAMVTVFFLVITTNNFTAAFLSSCLQSHLEVEVEVGKGDGVSSVQEEVYCSWVSTCTWMSSGVGRSSTKWCLEVVGVSFRGVTVLRGTEKLTSNLASSVRESRVNSEGDLWCKMTPTELETKLRWPTASVASTQSSRQMSRRSGRV